jgi:16S rRNA (uracil1498-N3)-methyltransferase
MYRHLVTPDTLLADTCVLGKEEARHLLTVLRVKPGDSIELFDGQGHTRQMSVVSPFSHFMKCENGETQQKSSKNLLCLKALAPVVHHPRPLFALTLFACVSKGKHMDWTLEKAVELGVARIVPVISERTIVRLDAKERETKTDRWMRIAEEAARQSGRAWLPEILPPCSLTESLPLVKETSPTFVAALTPDAQPLRDFLSPPTSSLLPLPSRAGWFVGPEGDFTPDELRLLLEAGAIPVSLGQNVLRTETACLYGLCALNCAWSS